VARGWESKSVEAQIEEGNQRPEQGLRPPNSVDARERELRLESLRLSRSRLLDQLERARHAAHREVLQNGLRAVEGEIEELVNSEPQRRDSVK
jgi:hypothetical protein